MRAIAFFFLFCLLTATVGYQLAFRLQLHQIKTELKRSLRQSRSRQGTVELTFDQEEAQLLQWEDEHEFSWKGRMYDVVERRQEGGRLVLRCLPDKKEDQLRKAFQQAAEKERRQARASWVKLMTAPFLSCASLLPQPLEAAIHTVYGNREVRLQGRALPIVAPPPEVG